MIFIPFHHATGQETTIEWNCPVCEDRLVALLPDTQPKEKEVKEGVNYLQASHRCGGKKPGLTIGVEE